MISNDDGWHRFAVEKLLTLLRGITSKKSWFYCLDCFHSFRIKSKLESHEKLCRSKDCWSEYTKILEFIQYQQSDKTPSIIYVDLESLIKKIDGLKTILKNHLQQK